MRWGRPFGMLAALTMCAGCSQNPQYRMAIADQTYDALGGLYVLLAKADLGALSTAASHPGTMDEYAEVIAGFRVGRLLVFGPPGTEADGLLAQIAGCVSEVERMSATHAAGGIAPGAPGLEVVRDRCDAAARAVAASAASSWILTTAAGDF